MISEIRLIRVICGQKGVADATSEKVVSIVHRRPCCLIDGGAGAFQTNQIIQLFKDWWDWIFFVPLQ